MKDLAAYLPVVLLFASACGSRGSSIPPVPRPMADAAPAPPPVHQEPSARAPERGPAPGPRRFADRAALGDVPAEIATGAFRSVEPADWPCALRQRWPDGEERHVRRLVYGARRECQIPVQMAFEGIVGCVDREVIRRNDRFYDLSRFSYAGGQIAQVENNGGVFRYDWEGGVPTLRGERPARRTPGRIEHSIVDRDVIDVDARSRPLRRWTVHNDRVDSSSELEWQAGRLVAVQQYTHDGDVAKKSFRLELVFDCSALPTLTKSANAEGPLGVPLQ